MYLLKKKVGDNMAFDKSAYDNKYKRTHYKKFRVNVKKAAAKLIEQKQREGGFDSFKDFFFYLYQEEYGVDLSKVKPKEPAEKMPSGED